MLNFSYRPCLAPRLSHRVSGFRRSWCFPPGGTDDFGCQPGEKVRSHEEAGALLHERRTAIRGGCTSERN
jgi:hypothetical protein